MTLWRDDPAFSPDPRAHPHFPLANALSFKALPSKSLIPDGLPSSPSVSSLSDTLFSPPLTTSSATSHSHRSPSPPPPPTKPILISKPPPSLSLPVPDIPPKPASTLSRARQALKPVQTNIPRKSRMKALVRRLTTRHNLDRIDELDETDPFGGSYHHDGPYEAISNNIAQSTLPSNSNPTPLRNNVQYPIRQSDPLPSRPSHHHSAARVPFAYGETGLSLHLEPGQILQQNTVYTSRGPSLTVFPPQFHTQPNTLSITTRPIRRQSLPIPQTLPPSDPSFPRAQGGFQTHKPFSLRTPPRERYLGEYAPYIPNGPPINHDHNLPSYVLHQPEKTVLPPPRYESILHGLGPPRSSQRTPPPPSNPKPPNTQSTESVLPAPPLPGSRHKSVHSLDSSHTAINSTITQSSSSIQSKHLDPTRIRHLPKRLVMPAPLQPQAAQPQYKFPPVEPSVWREGHPDHRALESAHFEGKPAKYSQEPRLLRKKSSAFPPKVPIPNIVPMSQDDAVPIMENPPGKTANEVEAKERTRRRRLSKRKSDI